MRVQWKRLLIVGLLVVALAALLVQFVAATPSPTDVIAVSAAAPGTTEDGLDYEPEDIIVRETVVYDTTAGVNTAGGWYMLFEGDAHGLNNKHDIVALSILPSAPVGVYCGLGCVEAIYMSFDADGVPVPGIPVKVPGQDVVVYTPEYIASIDNAYETYFDGSDVGLTTQSEKIDGLDVWQTLEVAEVEFPVDCIAGVLFISTQGSYRVPAANGGSLVGDGSDVLMFCATNLGNDTAGFWFRGFDSSDEGVDPPNALSGLDVRYFTLGPDEQEESEAAELAFNFIVKTTFTAPGAAGGPSELFWHSPGGTFNGPVMDFNQDYPALNGTTTGLDIIQNDPG